MAKPHPIVPIERIERRILLLRRQKVMLDHHLATLYGVKTRTLNQAVKRRRERFPDDFMFQLTAEEFDDLRSQSVTSRSPWGGRRYPPYAFTEQGVAMLSSVLNSQRAIRVNIDMIATNATPLYGAALTWYHPSPEHPPRHGWPHAVRARRRMAWLRGLQPVIAGLTGVSGSVECQRCPVCRSS